MHEAPTVWDREAVKAAIRRKGKTLRALALDNDLHRSSVSQALRQRMPFTERVIAAFIGVRPQDIWPDRYDALGNPLRGRSCRASDRSGPAAPTHRQKSRAA